MLTTTLFLCTQAWSALTTPLAPSNDSIMEILALPEANRLAVAKARGPAIYEELRTLANDPDRSLQTRWKALIIMAQSDPDRALKDLQAASRSKEWFIKNAALMAMQLTHPTEARTMAKTLLTDKALIVRSAAVKVLEASLAHEERQVLWTELQQPYNFHKGKSLWVRPQILNALAEKPESTDLKGFVAALHEKEPQMHVAALIAIEKITGRKFGSKKSTMGQKRNLALDFVAKGSGVY